MKVKMLTRNPDDYLRETKRDLHKVPRNYDPSLHPFEGPREYVRALNAVKLERMFAKPFVGNLDGHRDGISCIAKHTNRLSLLTSAAFDGEVRVWNLPTMKCIRSISAHDGVVRGVAFTPKGSHLLTAGDDKTIKLWETDAELQFGETEQPVNTILTRTIVTGISCHRCEARFATCGEVCQLWEETRNEPIKTLQWGVDSLHHVAFNPIETFVLGACASDRSIIIYDTRDTGPVRKVVMKLRANQLCWNPMEAFVFTVASEDYNLYTFDCRMLKHACNVHHDHVSAVTCIDYAPTGKEFVSGSYDKTIRIFECDKGHSREVYHTKRMQRLTSIAWSLDNKYVLSASDEMNVRVWKARASEKMGALRPREKTALAYAEALKKKFESHPQIKRIARHRHVPDHVYNAQNELRQSKNKIKRKESNRRNHSRPGSVPFVSERLKHIVREQE